MFLESPVRKLFQAPFLVLGAVAAFLGALLLLVAGALAVVAALVGPRPSPAGAPLAGWFPIVRPVGPIMGQAGDQGTRPHAQA